MTDVSASMPLEGAKPPLGIGSIISRTLSILGSRALVIFGIAVLVQLAFVLVNALVIAPNMLGSLDPGGVPAFSVSTVLISAALSSIVYSIMYALITMAAYDGAAGNETRLGSYISTTMRNIVPLVVVMFVSILAVYLGLLLLIVPGLWVMAVLSVVVPAVVIDKAGFGAFGRSARLTKEYRWPIVGLFIITGLIAYALIIVLNGLIATVFGLGFLAQFTDPFAVLASPGYQIVSGAIGALPLAFLVTVAAVLFARLKEIKEGLGFEDLSRVFD